jgi:hypothetical protein
MPGQDYGPGGKWIHDRAHGLLPEMEQRYGSEKGKQVAYAVATQMAHKVKKSPKDFRTPTGVREAKAKFDKPTDDYQKTASTVRMTAFIDELASIWTPIQL